MSLSKAFLITGPLRLAAKVHTHMKLVPLRVSHRLLSRPSCRSDQLSKVLRPLNDIPWASPM